MTGEVIPFRQPPSGNLRCECGSEWWSAEAICLSEDGLHITGYTSGLSCRSCGRPPG